MATIKWPLELGTQPRHHLLRIGAEFTKRIRERISFSFPAEPQIDSRADGYLWARTIRCPHCEGRLPLSPNWRLSNDGTGVKLLPKIGNGPGDKSRIVEFEIVSRLSEQSKGTVVGGDATCPFSDCRRLISGDEVKSQAQSGAMGEPLFAGVYKRREVVGQTKSGKSKEKWVRGYRPPTAADDVSDAVSKVLLEKMPEWEALDIVPTEAIGDLSNYDRGHRMYGMYRWVDMFNPRQLLGHCFSVEVFRELLDEESAAGRLDEAVKAAFVYLSFALDKLRDYNSRATRWIVKREVMATA